MFKWMREGLEIAGYIVVVLGFVALMSWVIGVGMGVW